jgi:predicted Zn-ribbon and HTH transcriptional regulator
MGAITEMILDGILCVECGIFIDEDYMGHPRRCEDCTKSQVKDLLDRKRFYKNQMRD